MPVPSVLDRPPVRQTLRVPEAARLLGVSKQLLYKMVADGRIDAVRIGDCVLLHRETVAALLGRPLPVVEEAAA